ncbi:cytochrome c biogenesis protein ResB [Phocaeicola faecalis]|uniref:cytochrome c biogenesis protein ResB n=1 Tax=Phocaeicola faecalis TaxID=2786956 RepID=UPI001F189149|nr:cytochrome c biogenesis protein ResB [Phocaeicola faecalis]
MWNKPWKLREGIMIGAGLLVTGILLQATVGKIEWDWIAFPVNVIVLAAFLILLGVMNALRKKVYVFGWLSHYTAAVSSLLWVVVATVLMGLVKQVPSHHAIDAVEGLFTQMLSSWSFVLLYIWMSLSLGMTILRSTFPFHWKKIPFLLNHVGLFIALVAATLGNADMQRLRMTTSLGNTEWRAQDEENQNLVELPLAIELNDFTIDEYPPKLMLIDNATGKVLPEDAPAHVLLEEGVSHGDLLDWELNITQSIPEAALVATEDTLRFTEFRSMGATYAIYLKAKNRKTHETKEGWVSCGSFMFPYKALKLNDRISMVMPEREPQRFASDVTLYTESGKQESGTIEVNKPYEIDGWKIYQLSYDETKGRWSNISVFELVRDPWLPYVYIGIGMMILGAVCLFTTAQLGRRESGQVEERKEAHS